MKPREIHLTDDDHNSVYLAYDGESLTIGIAGIQAGSGSTYAVLSKQEDIRAVRDLLGGVRDFRPRRNITSTKDGAQPRPVFPTSPGDTNVERIVERLDRIIELLEREPPSVSVCWPPNEGEIDLTIDSDPGPVEDDPSEEHPQPRAAVRPAELPDPMDRIRRVEDVLGGELFDRTDTVAERLDNHRRAINETSAAVRARDPVEDGTGEDDERSEAMDREEAGAVSAARSLRPEIGLDGALSQAYRSGYANCAQRRERSPVEDIARSERAIVEDGPAEGSTGPEPEVFQLPHPSSGSKCGEAHLRVPRPAVEDATSVEDDPYCTVEDEEGRQIHAWEARLSTRGLSLQDAVEMAMRVPDPDDEWDPRFVSGVRPTRRRKEPVVR